MAALREVAGYLDVLHALPLSRTITSGAVGLSNQGLRPDPSISRHHDMTNAYGYRGPSRTPSSPVLRFSSRMYPDGRAF